MTQGMIPKETDLTDDLARIMRERDYSPAPEPDGSIGNQEEDGVAYGISTVKSAGYTYLWNTDDHERSKFNNNAVSAKLKERFPKDYPNPNLAGQYAFTPWEPSEKPFRGTATCPLHPDRPEREEYDRKGHPTCNRIELPNEFEAREHLRLKHPRTWKAMQEEVLDNERHNAAEDRTLARVAMEKLAANIPSVEVTSVVSEAPTTGYVRVGDLTEAEVATVTTTNATEAVWVKHPHQFGKKVGSACKVEGCTEVRKVAFKKRNSGK